MAFNYRLAEEIDGSPPQEDVSPAMFSGWLGISQCGVNEGVR